MNKSFNDNRTVFGECLQLPYYCGVVENWMVTINAILIVLNLFSVLITITANTLFLLTYFCTRSLRNPHVFFLMLLAITDISVGLTSQPLFIAKKIMEIYGAHDCALWVIMRATVYYFSGISFLTLTLVSIERWYAVCKPIKHRQDVTPKRMAALGLGVWICWLIFPAVRFAVPSSYRVFSMFVGGLIIVQFFVNISLYVKIQRKVRASELRFSTKDGPRRDMREEKLQKDARMAKTVAVLLVVMVIAFLPTAVGLTYKSLRGVDPVYMFVFLPVADTLVLFNSTFNPLFYCYRNANIRTAILKQFRKNVAVNSDSSTSREPTFKISTEVLGPAGMCSTTECK